MSLPSGTVLADRYDLTDRIASGGMGDVYRAVDRRLSRTVAIKLLRTDDSVAEQRFATEVATHAGLQHPDIVVLFDADDHEGRPFLVMEYVGGPSLTELLRSGPLPIDQVRDTGRRIASALAYAHERGIIHRDVKPSNVLHDSAGCAKLADFGIVRLADAAGLTATGTALGSVGYVAPEQLTDGDNVGPGADVYALGLLLLEAATGERAFDGPGTEAAFQRLSRDPEVPEHLPTDLAELLRAMTQREPSARPSAAEVATRIAGDAPRVDATAVLPESPEMETTTPVTTATAGGSATGGPAMAGATEEPTEAIDAPITTPSGPPVRSIDDLVRSRPWAPFAIAAALGILVLVGITSLVGNAGEDAPDGNEATADDASGEGDGSDPEVQLDPDLVDAFDRLEEVVRP
ncbi:MAG: serine/threonine-protein kinase [Nitriliruptor sp.]